MATIIERIFRERAFHEAKLIEKHKNHELEYM